MHDIRFVPSDSVVGLHAKQAAFNLYRRHPTRYSKVLRPESLIPSDLVFEQAPPLEHNACQISNR